MGWQDHRQTNFACNSIGPNFNKPRKRCNSNDANSIFEQAAGELHAKLLWRGRQRGLAAVPVGDSGAGLRPVGRASTGSQGHRQTNFACNSIGPNFNKPRKRCNSNDANSIFEQAAGELHAKLLWRGRQRGLAAVPVGGGGAWPDNEPTHPPQTHFAHNFPRSLLEIARKRCNPNDMNSMFEVLAGELRAKLMGEQPVRQRPAPGCGARPAGTHKAPGARTPGASAQQQLSQHSRWRRRGRPRR